MGRKIDFNNFKLMEENNSITTKEIAETLGISSKGVEYHLSILRKQNVIMRVGGKRGGKWKILKIYKQ